MLTCTHDAVPSQVAAVSDLRIVLPPLLLSNARKWDFQGGVGGSMTNSSLAASPLCHSAWWYQRGTSQTHVDLSRERRCLGEDSVSFQAGCFACSAVTHLFLTCVYCVLGLRGRVFIAEGQGVASVGSF